MTRSDSEKWYLRKHMGLLAFFLTVTGSPLAIAVFPTAFTLSIPIFILIVGPGVFISYKRNNLWIVAIGLGSAAFGYIFCTSSIIGPAVTNAFQDDFVQKVLPALCLAVLPIALLAAFLARNKSHRHTALNAFIMYLVCLIMIVPFVYAGMLDFNHRADTSLPEVIRMEIVHMEKDSDGGCMLWLEAPDTGLRFFDTWVPYDFYSQHEVGSMIDVKIRKGALGYPWLQAYE